MPTQFLVNFTNFNTRKKFNYCPPSLADWQTNTNSRDGENNLTRALNTYVDEGKKMSENGGTLRK